MTHLMPRLKVGSVMVIIFGIQVAIWVFLPAISIWLAAGASLLWALTVTKFFTTGPNINFVTPLWVRRVRCLLLCAERG